MARKSHQDSAVRFVITKRGPEKATKTRQYDLYGQEFARKSHQDSAVRFVTATSWPERATETRQYDLLRPKVVQKESPRLGSTICYGQELAGKSHQDSAVRLVTPPYDLFTSTSWPDRATKIRQYDLIRPNVGQKEPPRLGSKICNGEELSRKSHQDSAVRFVTVKTWPERATKTRQYALLRPRVGQKELRDSAVQFVTAKRGPEAAIKTRQYDLLRPNVGQKEPPRLGSTICYGQELARKRHRDSARRFVTAKSWPERATKTRQYDLLQPNVDQKEPPRLGSTRSCGHELGRKNYETRQYDLLRPKWARKSHRDLAVRFVTAQSCPERVTTTRQYDLLRPRVGQKKPPRFGRTFCYGQELARKSHQDSAVRFVTAKSWPERAINTRQYDLSLPRVGQKEPPRLGSTICYGQELARKSHQDSAVRSVTAKSWPERATKTRQYDLLRPRLRQKEPPYDLSLPRAGKKEPLRIGSTICSGQTWARKSHQDCPEKAAKTRQYDLLRPRAGKKEPLRVSSTICSGQTWARKSHPDSAVRFVTAKRGPESATETRQYDLLRPNLGQKEPPRLGSTICCGQTWARKSHQDSAVRFVTAKSCPEKATKTRQYDLLRPRVGQKKPPYDLSRPRAGQKESPRLGRTICYGQTWVRKSHQDSAIRSVTAKSWPERATKARQYDLLRPNVGQKEPPRRPNVGQKEPPRLGSTICYDQELARKSHRDSAVRFVTAKSCPERVTTTRQYDLLRPRAGQKKPPRLSSTICFGQELASKSHQDLAV